MVSVIFSAVTTAEQQMEPVYRFYEEHQITPIWEEDGRDVRLPDHLQALQKAVWVEYEKKPDEVWVYIGNARYILELLGQGPGDSDPEGQLTASVVAPLCRQLIGEVESSDPNFPVEELVTDLKGLLGLCEQALGVTGIVAYHYFHEG